MIKKLFVFLLVLFSSISLSSCGNDEAIYTIVQFIEPHAAGCLALSPNSAYVVQVTFSELSGKPAFHSPDFFSISAVDEDSEEPIGWFEGNLPSESKNPYSTQPPASSFSFWYRTPDDVSGLTKVRIEAIPSFLRPDLQPTCQIIP